MVSLEYAKYSSVSVTKYEYINIEQLSHNDTHWKHLLMTKIFSSHFV